MTGSSDASKQAFGGSPSRRALLTQAGKVAVASAAFTMPGFHTARAQDAGTIKIGFIAPLSGLRASFTTSTDHTLATIRKALESGLQIGGKTYKVEIIVKDNQSTPARSLQVGNELILNDKPDIILVNDAEGATAIGPIADARGIPTLSTMGPWQAWAFARRYDPKVGFPFTFHFFFGGDELGRIYPAMWNRMTTNKKIGLFFADNDMGRVMSAPGIGFPDAFAKGGYEIAANTGLFRLDTDDFSTQIAAMKAANVDIVAGAAFENHVATFWNQAAQAGFKPKICTIAAGLLFPTSVKNLGDRGDGLSNEVWWTPSFPFKSSLTGKSAREIADEFTKATGKQWVQMLGYEHALFELGVNALKASGDPKNAKAVRDALTATKMDTIIGNVDFGGSPLKSVGLTHTVGGQWQKSNSGAFPFELQIVDNSSNPAVQTTAEFKPLAS